MEANPQVHILTYKINTTNRFIDDSPDNYIEIILIKLRKYLRNGPFNNSVEPYTGAFGLRGSVTPFGDKRFHPLSTDVVLIPSNTVSYIAGHTFFMPENVYEMISMTQLDLPLKNILKMIYKKCAEAAENDSILRSGSTQQFYKSLCKLIEIMVNPHYREVYKKLTTSSDNISDQLLPYLLNKLIVGKRSEIGDYDHTNPYNITVGGLNIQISDDTFITVPTHVHLLISEIKDPLRNLQIKYKRFLFKLIDTIISNNSARHPDTQQFYEDLLKDFAEKIIPNNSLLPPRNVMTR